MKKLHMKGFVLCLFTSNPNGLWDYEVAREVLTEYNRSGSYWRGEVRIILTDLYSCGLLEKIEDQLDSREYFGKGQLVNRFKLTAFGHQRMLDTGILQG